MPDASTFALFALASFALIVVPGPAVVYIVTRSLELGRSAGLVSMLGVEAGGLVHVTAAALGLSALIASSAAAFSVVKYLGAAYLVVIGVRRLVGRTADPLAEARAAPPRSRLFSQGVLVSVLNPKVAIFFLAFLPQFVDPDRGAVAPQVLLLGTCFIALAMLSDGAYAFLAGTLGDRVRTSTRMRHRLERASGAIYIALGAVAALAGRSELRSSS